MERKKKLMSKLKHSWTQFFSLGTKKKLGYLVKEQQLVRYGSILNKLLLDKDEESIYQNLNLKYVSRTIDFGFIPKVYAKNKNHSFRSCLVHKKVFGDGFLRQLKRSNLSMDSKKSSSLGKSNLNLSFISKSGKID